MKSQWFSLLLSGIVILVSANESSASSAARQVIRLHCGQTAADVPERQAQMLCRQMVQALAEAIPGTVIRRVSKTELSPTGSEEVSLTLNILGEDTANVTWQQGPAGKSTTGGTVALEQSFALATPGELKEFAHRVLSVEPSVLTEIGEPALTRPNSKP